MDATTLSPTNWSEYVTGAVGELNDFAGPGLSAVVLPGTLTLPASTMRNLGSIAVLRLRRGTLWKLSVVGHRWTRDRLAAVASMLDDHDGADIDTVLINRVSDDLCLPNLQIAIPSTSDLDGSSWDVRPLAVASGLARVFAGGQIERATITGADVEAIAGEIRDSLTNALHRFRLALDEEALSRCRSFGDFTFKIYDYLVVDKNRRNRMQFADVLPLFLPAIATRQGESPYREIRRAVDAGERLAPVVCKAAGVNPSSFRSLVGVTIYHSGSRWLDSPMTLVELIDSIRIDRRPALDPAAWARLNRLVEHAESVAGCRIEQSLAIKFWVREALNSRAGIRDVGTAPNFDVRTQILVDGFRDELLLAFGSHQQTGLRAKRPSGDDALRKVVERWILKSTRKQLCTLAPNWMGAYTALKARDEDLIATMRGKRYWPLLPSSFSSADGTRRVVPLISQKQLADFGVSMANCLATAYLKSYDAACRSGTTYLVGLLDNLSCEPCSIAELKLELYENSRLAVSVVQHTAKMNANPGRSCISTVDELLQHVQGTIVQAHLRLGFTVVRATRKQGTYAISQADRDTRRRALRYVLGDLAFEELRQQCECAPSG